MSVFALQTPLVAAVDEGFFREEGLDVSYERTVSSTEQMQALVNGTFDVAQTAADNIVARVAEGTKDTCLFHVADLGLDQFAVARTGVTTWQDVRTVAVDAASSGYAYVLYALLAEHGLPRGAYGVHAVGGPAARLQQLCEGQADLGLLNPHLAGVAVDRGLHVLARAADSFPGYPNLVFAATPTALHERRAELAAFARAVDRGVLWASDPAHADRAAELLMKARSCSADEARTLYERERTLRTVSCPDPRQTVESLQSVTDLRARMGGGRPRIEEYFTPLLG